MSGWYVRELLLNKDMIRASLFSPETSSDFSDGFIEIPYVEDDYCDCIFGGSLDADVYDDLLTVEIALNKLIENKEIKETDIEIIKFILDGKDVTRVSERLNMDVRTVYYSLERVFKKVAESLGGYFTDEGYIELLRKKHYLSVKQIKILRKSMNKSRSMFGREDI